MQRSHLDKLYEIGEVYCPLIQFILSDDQKKLEKYYKQLASNNHSAQPLSYWVDTEFLQQHRYIDFETTGHQLFRIANYLDNLAHTLDPVINDDHLATKEIG